MWHGTDPTNKTRKIPGALKFVKLRVIPDQFYYNSDDVRNNLLIRREGGRGREEGGKEGEREREGGREGGREGKREGREGVREGEGGKERGKG